MAETKPTPDEQVRSLYEDTEAKLAGAAEELVGTDSFGELLARLTGNVMALTRIGNDLLDLAVRNLRVAGRQDVTRLARQLARTEDKLELVLQHVERLEQQLERNPSASRDDGRRASGRPGSSSRGGTRSSSGNGRRRRTS